MNKNLIIFGNSSMGEIAYFYFNKFYNYKKIIITCEKKFEKFNKKKNKNFISLNSVLKLNKKDNDVFVAIGYSNLNQIRQKFVDFFKKKRFNLVNFIHPLSQNYSKKMGINNFIMDNVSINPYTTIGDGNIIWSTAVIGHHNKIGNFNFFSGNSSISGNSIIKDNCFFGVNSSVKNDTKVNSFCLIDAGEYVNLNLKKFSFCNKILNPNKKILTKDFIELQF